jgi:hypothetical protein
MEIDLVRALRHTKKSYNHTFWAFQIRSYAFWVTQCCATFQRFMDEVLRGLIRLY